MGETPRVGDIIDERFELLRQIGSGGFGTVYQARQLSTGQLVAIKFMTRDVSGRRGALEIARFEREMKLISELRHPNIVTLIDSGRLVSEAEHFFIVLEYIDGVSLDALLSRDGPLPLRTARRIMTQVMEALRYAHSRGIVHRDLKPANIMISDPGPRCAAKILDFGIAAITEEARKTDYKTLTGAGQLPGTLAYMAPEQIGEGKLTARIDIYAWGLLFHESLTGRPLVAGDSLVKLIFKQMSDEPVPLDPLLVDTAAGALIARAVAKRAEDRFPDADAALDALDELDIKSPEHRDMERALRLTWERLEDPESEARTTASPIGLDETNDSAPDTPQPFSVSHRTGEPPIPRDSGEAGDAAQIDTGVHQAEGPRAPGLEDTIGEDQEVPVPPAQPAAEGESEFVDQPGDRDDGATKRWFFLGFAAVVLVVLALWLVVTWSQTDEGDGGGTPGGDDLSGEPPDQAEHETTAASANRPTQCPGGKVVSDATSGRCCWPGQVWHPSKEVCFGPADSCPDGMRATQFGCEPVVREVEPPKAPPLPEAPGTLSVLASNPPGVEVIVDGRIRGEAPGEFENVPLGLQTVVFRREGYRREVQVVELQEDTPEVTIDDVTLSPRGNGEPAGMVLIGGGSFWMGCVKDDGACEPQEKPGGEFVLAKSFWIGRTEVTVEEYAKCVDEGACKPPVDIPGKKCNWGVPGRELHPVNCVSYHDAQIYCEAIGQRLPTEAEWERAARLNTRERYPWGNEVASCEVAVVQDGGDGCGLDHTDHVWSKPAGRTATGLFNMSGNVEEWTSDWFAQDFLSTAPRKNPRGQAGSSERTARGGGFDDTPLDVRLSFRDGEAPRDGDDDLGFRCAR